MTHFSNVARLLDLYRTALGPGFRVGLLTLTLVTLVALAPLASSGQEEWPDLPAANAMVKLPAQEWPLRPGPRTIEVWVHYPKGKLEAVGPGTGLMLTLHNWGGTASVGTADPNTLANSKADVVAISLNYLQSGPKDSIEGPEPYDFGYLQSLDALRALSWMFRGLKASERPFAADRIYCTGGSGGGNVALMANKLAPRTFACVIDLCGMKKLTDDIAFNLPGGSDLNARYRREPADPYHLTLDHQELRFLGNRDHLAAQRRFVVQPASGAIQQQPATPPEQLVAGAKIVVVHGVDDRTCPFADAVEMVDEMRRAGLDVESDYIAKKDVDGQILIGTGHSLGDRTRIVLQRHGHFLTPGDAQHQVRRGPTDFERREDIRYSTSNGQFIINYTTGYPVGRFEKSPPLPDYPDHHQLLVVREIPTSGDATAAGTTGAPPSAATKDRVDAKEWPVKSVDDWRVRTAHIRRHFERTAGPFPSPLQRVPLDVRQVDEVRTGDIVRRKLSYQSDANDRVTAYLLYPASFAALLQSVATGGAPPPRPPYRAVLALQQTTNAGKDEPAGVSGDPELKYALELAERGFVVIAPDYPSFGEHAYDFAPSRGYVSGTMKAVWDNVRAIDVLETLPGIDHRRVGCIGHSLGGHNAIFTALFEPRIAAVVSSCGFSSMRKDDVPSWTGPRYMPRIASEFGSDVRRLPWDFPELIGSIAPRAFFACAATKDGDFDVGGVRDVLAAAGRVYELLGAKEKLVGDFPEAPHSFPAESRRRAYAFLMEQLDAR